MSEHHKVEKDRIVAILDLVLASFLICGAIALIELTGGSSYLEAESPAAYLYQSIRSLSENGTFHAPYFDQVEKLARQHSIKTQNLVWQDVYCVTSWGAKLPKQAPLMALIGAPVYGVGGLPGLWFVNVFMITLVIILSYFALPDSVQIPPMIFVFVYALFTETFWHSFSFSYDVLAGLCIVIGITLISRLKFLGAVLVSMVTFFRPSNILLCLALPLVAKDRRDLLYVSAGILVGPVLFLLVNLFLFGSPFLTSYSRAPFFEAGVQKFYGHKVGFSLETFLSSIGPLLFSLKRGWLVYNPLLLLLPFVWWDRKNLTRVQKCAFCLAAINFFYIASYEMWSATIRGNRFLLPALWLLLPIALGTFARFLKQKELSMVSKSS